MTPPPAASDVRAGDLRIILGLKLKTLRTAARLSLKDVSARAGVSISYLSEIEQGKKYPKPEKLVDLARALDADYNELVSLHVADDLGPIRAVVQSPVLREFPLALFGVEPERVVALLRDEPGKAGALVHAIQETSQVYDVGLGDLLRAALRSYQQLHRNHFPDLERAAEAFRDHTGMPDTPDAMVPRLRRHLAEHYGYTFDETTLARHPVLSEFRSVYAAGLPPKLYLNSRLSPAQRAFLLAREVAFNRLQMVERATTSTWLEVTSFEQLLNTLRGSYFAGALLVSEARMKASVEGLFAMERWRDEALLGSIRAFGVTPEMYFYRLTQILPTHFGLGDLYFTRVTQRGHDLHLTRLFNLTDLPLMQSFSPGQHACRRWEAATLLRESPPHGSDYAGRAQRSRFFAYEGATYFTLAAGRALALDRSRRSAVSVGIRMDDRFSAVARFAADEAIPVVDVHLTCERCTLAPEACAARVAPPTRANADAKLAAQKQALAELVGR